MRKLVKRALASIDLIFDKKYLATDVPMSNIVSHKNWRNYLYERFNKPGIRILEIGSREVTGESSDRNRFSEAEYTGFDYYEGGNWIWLVS